VKILLLGKSGQVGWELQRSLAPLGELVALDRSQADFSKPESLRKIIAEIKPNWIVNAAAYTAVDKAESEQELAHTINAKAAQVLAEEASKLDAWLIHYSTDYVYDGRKSNAYNESDEVNPLSVYGASKLAGEKAIQKSNCNYLIFRTSWVFAAKGNNFAKSMMRLASERDELKIVADQFGAPTSAELIADVSALCMQQLIINEQRFSLNGVGIYHLVASGEASWHSFAQYVINKAEHSGVVLKATSQKIMPITTDEYPLPAKRPCNSRLCTNKLTEVFSIKLPHWSVYVDRMLEEII
jgi:dTDP-4-dehydrorhamnose reductase